MTGSAIRADARTIILATAARDTHALPKCEHDKSGNANQNEQPNDQMHTQGASAVGTRAAMGGKLDGAIGDGQPQRRADRALDQADFAAMGAH